MLRNLGGSVGIAILSTLFTMREQFHSAKLGEGVTVYSQAVQERLLNLTMFFTSKGYDPKSALEKAVGAVDFTVRKQASVMAFNDCFYFVSIALVLSSFLILFCQKVSAGKGASDAH